MALWALAYGGGVARFGAALALVARSRRGVGVGTSPTLIVAPGRSWGEGEGEK